MPSSANSGFRLKLKIAFLPYVSLTGLPRHGLKTGTAFLICTDLPDGNLILSEDVGSKLLGYFIQRVGEFSRASMRVSKSSSLLRIDFNIVLELSSSLPTFRLKSSSSDFNLRISSFSL